MTGKRLRVRGYYLGTTPEGDKLNAQLAPAADIMSKGPLCVFPASAKPALDKLKDKSLFTASGTVTGDFFGRPLLSDCTVE